MKKLFTLLTASLLALSAFAATDVAVNEAADAEGKQLHPFKDFSHWSISVNGGLSQFDGDVNQKYNQLLSNSGVLWTVGIDVEYSFNPAWGLILNFQYNPYQGKTGSTDFGNNYFRGNMYNLNLMGSINVLNLFAQYRKSWRWAWYINGGLGFTFYDAKSYVGSKDGPLRDELKSARCMSFPLGTQVEYNINEWLAVGINAYYAFHNKDNFEVENYTKGTLNDGEFYAMANLRVKFCQKKREGGHMRNISMYDLQRALNGEKSFQSELDSLKKRVKAIEDTLANNVFPRLDSLEATSPDDDEDSVPNFRDREPNTPKGSFVNYWGESLRVPDCSAEIQKLRDELNYDLSVYFDFDKYYLTPKAKRNVELAAKKLQANPNYKVELRGYCDFPGKADYNLKLSDKRVETVKNELVDKYGIDPARISMTGKGKMENPPRKEDKNRRCDFIFYE